MKNGKNMQLMGTLVAVAQAERQLREVKGLVDRSLATAQRFWIVVPLLAAGWAFMVSDEERYAVLEQVADQVLDRLPPFEPLQRLLAS
jgi:hypothetical protein